MAAIDDLVDYHFEAVGERASAQGLIGELDAGLLHVGKMAEAIHDHASVPLADIDPEAIVASALGLISFLGRMGEHLDALADIAIPWDGTRSDRPH